MKALVGQISELKTDDTRWGFNVVFHDNTGLVEFYNFDLVYDQTLTLTSAKADIISKVLTRAAAQSYTMTAADIVVAVSNLPLVRTFGYPSRSLNSAFQISTAQDADVTYSVNIVCAAGALSPQKGRATLQYADDNTFGGGSNVVSVSEIEFSNGALLGLTNGITQALTGKIPSGKWVRLLPAQVTGTPTITLIRSQEVLLP